MMKMMISVIYTACLRTQRAMLEVWRWRAGRHWLSRHPTVLSSWPVRHSCCAVRYTVLHTENRTNLVQAAQQTVSLTQTHLN